MFVDKKSKYPDFVSFSDEEERIAKRNEEVNS
jgi:hypothetical protein